MLTSPQSLFKLALVIFGELLTLPSVSSSAKSLSFSYKKAYFSSYWPRHALILLLFHSTHFPFLKLAHQMSFQNPLHHVQLNFDQRNLPWFYHHFYRFLSKNLTQNYSLHHHCLQSRVKWSNWCLVALSNAQFHDLLPTNLLKPTWIANFSHLISTIA